MQLTREQAIAEHRKMWNCISEKIEKSESVQGIEKLKDEYLGELIRKEYLYEYPVNGCFLFDYAYRENQENMLNAKFCIFCPVETESVKNRNVSCLAGLYVMIKRADTWQEQAKLARQIANLPERENV